MTFEKYVSNFMNSNYINLSPKPRGYNKDLMVFHDYLKSRDVTSNIDEFVRGVDTNTIIDSIDYYIKANKIKKVSTVQRYVSAVKEFLLYLVSNDYVSNDAFLKELGSPAYKEGSFRNKINIYLAENSELDKSISYDPLTQDEVEDLIKESNFVLEIPVTKVTRSKEMNMITSALIIKLILLIGVPYREIIKIPVESYNITFGSFSINGITIRLPEGIIKQFNCYLELREKIARGREELFVTYSGKPLPKGTAQVTYWLKQLSGRQDLTGLIKFAIVQMMNLNISHIAIEKFTKVGYKIIMSCKEQLIKEQGDLLGIELDSLLRRSPVFNKL
ncbi:site-specific recombinase XerD [Fontibacillus phaseoli]|uniref:Site-specific recombinase XerD n=1 Tax=Fontibacillus phaseoli TaxID=1416533 RepID=A0A369BDU4_9BACL|nr:hypothetical protein [Fontibacillus phaseoli]RCX19729.1 site-specific recombinase XerD [Fontibacillus phaseoli]